MRAPRRVGLVAVLVTLLCVWSVPADAFVFVVADLLNIAKHEALNAWAEAKNALLEDQINTTWHLVQRLSLFTDLTNYLAPMTPPWLLRGITSAFDELASSAAMERALQGQRPADESVALASRQLLGLGDVPAQLGTMNPATAAALRAELATLDIGASALMVGTQQTGAIRGNRYAEENLIQALVTDVMDPSDKQSATAAADKLSAALLIQTRQQESRAQLGTALTEQLLVDQKRDRDAEVETMNMRLRAMQEGRDVGRSYIAGSAGAFQTWRQP